MNSKIGGQAVMEGVMMRNADQYAVAVRLSNKEIHVEKFRTNGSQKLELAGKIPIIRGVVNFISSLVLGIKTLTYSASFFEDEENQNKEEDKKVIRNEEIDKNLENGKSSVKESAAIVGTVVVAIGLAIVLFMILPYGLSLLFGRWIGSVTVLSLIEGAIRLIVFLIYVWTISKMEDIKRVFMYHGAEHKSINCIEHGLDLTLENVRASSRFHKRCGTSFLLIVMVVSIIFFAFIRVDSPVLRLVIRLLLIPIVGGVSYEFIRLAGNSESKIIEGFAKPGLWLQKLTTKEPDDTMIEVGMASVEAVFEWKPFVEKVKRDDISETIKVR